VSPIVVTGQQESNRAAKRAAEGGGRGRNEGGGKKKWINKPGPGERRGIQQPAQQVKTPSETQLGFRAYSIIVKYINNRPQAMGALDTVMEIAVDMARAYRQGRFSNQASKVVIKNLPGCGSMHDDNLETMMREVTDNFK
jgi:hypothetical protein